MYIGGLADPQEWVQALSSEGYRCARCPVSVDASADEVRAYRDAAREADITIAEVGAWSNPLSPDAAERRAAFDLCVKSLRLADEIGARCCVNIAGSRSNRWDGPHRDNLTEETFDMIVESVRGIIDEVRPTRSFYALECMPWIAPDTIESYSALVRAVDRERFAVHFDPVNMIHTLADYFDSASFIRRFCRTFGPLIRSGHAKDTLLEPTYTLKFAEVQAGKGLLDYSCYLREMERFDHEMPLVIEHLSQPEEYREAASYIRQRAAEAGVSLA